MNLSLLGLISLFSLTVLVISPCSAFNISIQISDAQEQHICLGIQDPKICKDYFNEPDNIRASTDDKRRRILWKMFLNRTRDGCVENYGFIQSLINQTTDKVLQERYFKCLEFFDKAEIIIKGRATKELKANHYSDVKQAAYDTMDEVERCLGLFSSPPAIPPVLDEKLHEFDRICYLFSLISWDFYFNDIEG